MLLPALLLAASPSTFGSPTDLVQAFYGHVIQHHPIGIPTGEAKGALWPLLSLNLTRRLNALQACEDDYYRRNRKILAGRQLKPSIGWLEYGLFSGGDERALPAEVAVKGVDAADANRFRVNLTFTYRDTFETYGRPPTDANTFQWTGIAVVVFEVGRFALDDYIPVDRESGREQTALSEDFPECRGPKWIGLKGQRY
jgi:hypothetical protein